MWCVLTCDGTHTAYNFRIMAGDVTVIGSYRSEAKASEVANQINRKIEIHSSAMAWPSIDGPRAWVQEMRTKRTEVYEILGIRRLR